MATNQTSLETQAETRRSLVARVVSSLSTEARQVPHWIRSHPLQTGAVGGGLLLVLLLVNTAMWLYASLGPQGGEKPTIAMALAAYDVGDFVRAREIAEQLNVDHSIPFDKMGGPTFVLGAITFHDAEAELNQRRKRHLYRVASRYLDEANDYGFPPAYRAEGLAMLAISLYKSRQYAAAILILHEALEQNPHRAAEFQRMLAGAYFRDRPPQYGKALEHLLLLLADEKLRPVDRHAALLEQIRIHLAQGKLDEAQRVLDEVPDDSPLYSEKLALLGQLLLRKGDLLAHQDHQDEAREKYAAAVTALRLAEGTDTSRNETTPKAEYLLGAAYRKAGELSAAERQFHRTAKLREGTHEGAAAAFEAAEVKQQLGKADEAVAAYRYALEQIGDPSSYHNPWIPLAELQQRAEEAYAEFRSAGNYAQAVELAVSLTPLLAEDYATQLRAEAYRAWGENLLRRASDVEATDTEQLAEDGYARLRDAGRVYARVALLRRATRDYPTELWNSAEGFLDGHDFHRAVLMLTAFLEAVSRPRRPQALVALGQAYLALDETEQALEPLQECITEFSKHPSVYLARLLAARVYEERGENAGAALENLEQAQTLLEDNLHNEALTPQSVEWRDSLFELGRVLFRKGVLLEEEAWRQGLGSDDPEKSRQAMETLEGSHVAFQLAAEKLTEAVARYPEAPAAIEARYLVAEGHRRAAEYAGRRRAQAVIEATRLALEQQEMRQLSQAGEAFAELVVMLNEASDHRNLTDIESGILRNAYFGKADALFKQRKYEEALTAYGAAADRLHDRPVVLEALVQMARCQRELGEPELARGALERARATINRLPEDLDFTETTRYDRAGWLETLNWLITLYTDKQGKV